MSTTSTNFKLVIATTSDVANVVTQVAGNFSTIDSLLGVVHTGTGALKAGLSIQTPTLISPTVSGTLSASTLVASTGSFNTITATGGALTVNAFTIGTYGYPAAVGSTGQLLTVVTGNAVFVTPAGGTGAGVDLSNLASVAINTSLNTFSAGFVTVARIIATSGAITGLTSFQATTGTFAGNVTITGTLTANAVNCTGGAITAGGITVGTWALPSTIGSSNQILKTLSATATWATPIASTVTAFCFTNVSSKSLSGTGIDVIGYTTELFDMGNNATTGTFTAPTSGLYEFNCYVVATAVNTQAHSFVLGILIDSTSYNIFNRSYGAVASNTSAPIYIAGAIIGTVTSGSVVTVFATDSNAVINIIGGPGTFSGKRLFEL